MTTMQTPYGTEQQVSLRHKVDNSVGWLITTPGACHGGRFFATDDPDLLGWDVIFKHLQEDGVFGFRLIAAEDMREIEAKLAEQGYGIDYWDVFSARANTIREALRTLDLAPPPGYRLIDAETLTYPDTIREAQAFMAANGIAPMSAAMLSGRHGPCVLTAITGPNGAIVATAFGYFPHNVHSPLEDTGWGGLVAVDPDHRGEGLGTLANALMMRGMIEQKGARAIYELVSAGNEHSRRMAERCGLSFDTTVKAGLAGPEGSERFTA